MTQKLPNFSLAFQQMASFVAIAKTSQPNQTQEQLILQAFVVEPTALIGSATELVGLISDLFGIPLSEREVAVQLAELIAEKKIERLPGGHLSLAPAVERDLKTRIEEAKSLENEIKSHWLDQVSDSITVPQRERLWDTLKAYLTGAFRRHGMQTISLLDASLPTATGATEHLSSILDAAVGEHFPEAPELAKAAISRFFKEISGDRKRAAYIARLADGAFNYFSLAVAPEVSKSLRAQLSDLVIFLDTNFIFGLLKLHVHPQVEVSGELVEAIRKFKLPLRLRYHDSTKSELNGALRFYEEELKRQRWPQVISRAIVAANRINGVEYRYHEKNSQTRLDVEDFFAPYRNWELTLKAEAIDVYQAPESPDRLHTRADLEAEYREFLEAHNKNKAYDLIQHDVNLLLTVRKLRSSHANPLEAKTILLTCDFMLAKFDWENSRALGIPKSVVMPNHLWQMLRPFITMDDESFDRAFAETFALPEFSLNRGGAQKAAGKLASILAGYGEISEATATTMLSNDLFLHQLSSKSKEDEFFKEVESELARQNSLLVQEKQQLSDELAGEKQALEAKQAEIVATLEALQAKEREMTEAQRRMASAHLAISQQEESISVLQTQKEEGEAKIREIALKVVRESQELERAQREKEALKQRSIRAEQNAQRSWAVMSITVSFVPVAVAEAILHRVPHFAGLLVMKNSTLSQICFAGFLYTLCLAIMLPKWRSTLWTAAFGLAIALIGILAAS